MADDASTEHLRALLNRGEYLLAYDDAVTLLAERPGDLQVEYLAVLALARSGATERAVEQYATFGLGQAEDRGAVGSLAEDIAALEARVAKDRALQVTGDARRDLAAKAAHAYESIHLRYDSTYTGINAATMWCIAGSEGRCRRIAGQVLALCDSTMLATADYWVAATIAEAALLLDDLPLAAAALDRAAAMSSGEYATRATTRRQLALICDIRQTDPTILRPLDNPGVIHFAGHRIAPPGQPGRFPASEEPRVAAAIADHLAGRGVGFGHGSLASGADILFAEALLDRGAELHVVLPFARDEFAEASVAHSGASWVTRYERCLDAATSVTYASDGQYLGDPVMFDFCAQVAMGEAIQRADRLASPLEQVVVWDGISVAPDAVAGTAMDIARWRALGRPATIIASAIGSTPSASPTTAVTGPRQTSADRPDREDVGPEGGRVVRAMLFADIAGFSTLTDEQIPIFMTEVMGALATTVDTFGADVLVRATWGDGIYLVFPGVRQAAQCALAMQATLRSLDLVALGLPTLRGMRIGGHVGPVFAGWDTFRGEATFFGSNVTRAARIEPRTPEGEVYVTHPFAALVALDGGQAWSCQYVGHIPSAKDYGILPMYVLKPASAPQFTG